MDDILTTSINGSGYNSKYGLLGSNRATEDKVKAIEVASPKEHAERILQSIIELTK